MKNTKRFALGVLIGLLAVANASAQTFPITIDATALTSTSFLLIGTGAPPDLISSTSPQTINLPAGTYAFQVGAGVVMSCVLVVSAPGTVSYDSSCNGFLSGNGTAMLTIRGYTINVDARALSSTGLLMANLFGATVQDSKSSVLHMTLVPCSGGNCYEIQPGSLVANFAFGLDATGNITYAASFDGFASGRTTPTLVLSGFTVNIDARPLSADQFLLPSVFGLDNLPGPSTSTVEMLHLLPVFGGYQFQIYSGESADFTWNIDLPLGNVNFSGPSTSSYLSASANTLRVNGYPVFVDATALGPGKFQFFAAFDFGFGSGALNQSVVNGMTLVPEPFAQFCEEVIGPCDWEFFAALQPNGTWNYDPSLDSCVSGRNTNRLIVFCNPGVPPPNCQQLIQALQSYIQGLPASAFRNSNSHLAGALVNKLNAVSSQLAAAEAETDSTLRHQLVQDILDKLQNDLLPKADGCSLTAAPDAGDWITDCNAQDNVHAQLQRIIMCISALLTT